MGDEMLHRKFGVTSEQLDAWADEYESPDWSHMKFGETVEGEPEVPDGMSEYDEQRLIKMMEDYREGRLETVTLDEVERMLGLDG